MRVGECILLPRQKGSQKRLPFFVIPMFSVYILKSQITGKYYCGQTSDLKDRMLRHNSGRNKYTRHGAPWNLIYYQEFSSRSEAVQLERQIKKRGIGRYLEEVRG